ncbi:MAG: transglutaminase domain-containing protein [Planctomycetes bacterium]|nr:transglutaminase domain-containing protein [Planctomycetota bacterium]
MPRTSLPAIALLLAFATTLAAEDPVPPPPSRPAVTCAPYAKGDERRFRLQHKGKDIGVSWFRIVEGPKPDTLGIEGETTTRMILARGPTLIAAARVSVIPAKGALRPSHYRLSLARNDDRSTYDCDFDADGKTLHLTSEIGGKKSAMDRVVGAKTFLLDYNAPEHFELLLRANAAIEKKTSAFVWVPDMMTALPVTIEPGQAETLKIEEAEVPAQAYTLNAMGMEYSAWLDTRDGTLVKVAMPGQGLTGFRTTKRLEEIKIETADILSSFEVEVKCPEELRKALESARKPGAAAKVVVRVHVKAQIADTDEAIATSPRAAFDGTVKDRWIDGTLTLVPQGAPPPSTRAVEATEKTSIEQALAATEQIDFGDPEIRSLAIELGSLPEGGEFMTADKATIQRHIARQIVGWVHENIAYENLVASASGTLAGRRGDCLSKARLAIALCRMLRLPARTVGGLQYSGGHFAQHHWMEVRIGETWEQWDPTTGQIENGTDGLHLPLWREGVIDTSEKGWVEIREIELK